MCKDQSKYYYNTLNKQCSYAVYRYAYYKIGHDSKDISLALLSHCMIFLNTFTKNDRTCTYYTVSTYNSLPHVNITCETAAHDNATCYHMIIP